MWPYTDRQAYQCLISLFLVSLGACSLILYICVTIHVVVNWQLSKQCICWPVSRDGIAGSGSDPLISNVLFWNYPLTSYYFSNDRRLKFDFKLKNFDFKRTSDAKIQAAFTCRKDSRFWLFSPWSHLGHALCPIFMLWLVKIWQVTSCGKFMQHLESCFLIAEADRVLYRHLVMF